MTDIDMDKQISTHYQEKARGEKVMAIELIDFSPTPDLALRILRAYRQRCDSTWTDNTSGRETVNRLIVAMNKLNRERAKLLDKAILVLEGSIAYNSPIVEDDDGEMG